MVNNPTAGLEPRTGSPASTAGAWIRFAALFIDFVAATVLLLTVSFAVGAAGLTDGLSELTRRHIVAALMLLYFVGFQAWVGWSPGMRALGLRVKGAENASKPSFAAALIRNCYLLVLIATPDTELFALISFAVMLTIGYTISKSPRRQGIHDRLAGGTQVVAYQREGTAGWP